MPNLGPLEIVTIAVVALIVFGPRRLPEIARTVGRAVNELRRMASDVRSEFDTGFGLEDDDDEDLAVDDDDTPTADGVAESGAARTGRPAARSTADGIAAAGRAAQRAGVDEGAGHEPSPAHGIAAAGRAAAARGPSVDDAAEPEPSPAEIVTADGVVTADAEAGPGLDDDERGDAPSAPAS